MCTSHRDVCISTHPSIVQICVRLQILFRRRVPSPLIHDIAAEEHDLSYDYDKDEEIGTRMRVFHNCNDELVNVGLRKARQLTVSNVRVQPHPSRHHRRIAGVDRGFQSLKMVLVVLALDVRPDGIRGELNPLSRQPRGLQIVEQR